MDVIELDEWQCRVKEVLCNTLLRPFHVSRASRESQRALFACQAISLAALLVVMVAAALMVALNVISGRVFPVVMLVWIVFGWIPFVVWLYPVIRRTMK